MAAFLRKRWKSVCVGVLGLMLAVLMIGCECEHIWVDQGCREYQVCSKCGTEGGQFQQHDFVGRTCENFGSCTQCGQEQYPQWHQWKEEGDVPNTCLLCGVTAALPEVTEEMRGQMPEISQKLRQDMGAGYTQQFEQKVDTTIAAMLKAYEDCIGTPNKQAAGKVIDLAMVECETLVEAATTAVETNENNDEDTKFIWEIRSRICALCKGSVKKESAVLYAKSSVFLDMDETSEPEDRVDYEQCWANREIKTAEYINALSQFFYECDLIPVSEVG